MCSISWYHPIYIRFFCWGFNWREVNSDHIHFSYFSSNSTKYTKLTTIDHDGPKWTNLTTTDHDRLNGSKRIRIDEFDHDTPNGPFSHQSEGFKLGCLNWDSKLSAAIGKVQLWTNVVFLFCELTIVKINCSISQALVRRLEFINDKHFLTKISTCLKKIVE